MSEFVRQRGPLQLAAVTRASARVDGDIVLELSIEAERQLSCAVEIKVMDQSGTPVGLASLGGWRPEERLQLRKGITETIARISTSTLATGTYRMVVALTNPGFEYYDLVSQELTVSYEREMEPGETRALSQAEGHGSVRLSAAFETAPLQAIGLPSCRSVA